jgi:hypothetical protein
MCLLAVVGRPHSWSSFVATFRLNRFMVNEATVIQHGVVGCNSAWSSFAQRVTTSSHSMA